MKQLALKMTKGILIAGFAVVSLGCSNQWREANFELDSSELDTLLADVTVSNNDGNMTTAKAQISTEGAMVFYSEGPGAFGPVASVASLYNFDFLGSQGSGLLYFDLSEVRVFLTIIPGTGEASLIFAYQTFGNETWQSAALVGSYSISSNKFTANLTNSQGLRVILTSFDVIDGDMAQVVQMKMRSEDANGVMDDNGQFSTLMGFSI